MTATGLDYRAAAREVVNWFLRNARDLPWRRTRDPYGIWVSEIMLQQTQVKTVIPYWERWMTLFPHFASLAAAEEEKVLKAWEGLGYYSRARNMMKAAREVQEKHAGVFPTDFTAVIGLPGIGRYTAGAICSIAFGQPTPILDGNVARVLARLVGARGVSASERERLWAHSAELVAAADRLGKGKCSELNQGLMELGALICVPREPNCGECPLKEQCAAFQTGRVGDFPGVKERPVVRQRRFVAFLWIHNGNVLVRRRKAGVVNGGLWEFPNFEVKGRGRRLPMMSGSGGLEKVAEIKHTITNNRITLQAFRGIANGNATELAATLEAEWKSLSDLNDLPFSSAHSRLRAIVQGEHVQKIRVRHLESGARSKLKFAR